MNFNYDLTKKSLKVGSPTFFIGRKKVTMNFYKCVKVFDLNLENVLGYFRITWNSLVKVP